MGKAVPKGIKSKALLLLKEFPEKFTADFENNKKALEEFGTNLFSKTNRNLVVGFMSRKVRQQQKKEEAKAAARKADEKAAERKAAAENPAEKAPEKKAVEKPAEKAEEKK